MGTAGRLFAALTTAGTAIGGFLYYRSLQRTSTELEVTHKLSIANLSLAALTLRIDVVLKNPTRNKFKISFPYVRMEMNGTTIGSSQIVDQQIQVPSMGEVHIDNITIPISTLEALTALITPLQTGQGVQINVISETTINVLGILNFPFQKAELITLKSSANAS
jgi:hypothetical protein